MLSNRKIKESKITSETLQKVGKMKTEECNCKKKCCIPEPKKLRKKTMKQIFD